MVEDSPFYPPPQHPPPLRVPREVDPDLLDPPSPPDNPPPSEPPVVSTTETTTTTVASGPQNTQNGHRSWLSKEIRNLCVAATGLAVIYMALVLGNREAQIGLVTFFIQQITAISTERTALKQPGRDT